MYWQKTMQFHFENFIHIQFSFRFVQKSGKPKVNQSKTLLNHDFILHVTFPFFQFPNVSFIGEGEYCFFC